jgi:hypothetical protein
LKARVTVGAVTSMADLLTDVYVTYMFWSDGKEGYFKASLASLLVSVGFQLFMVWTNNKKLGMKRVLREWFPILLGYKPALDAYKVAKGEKQEAGTSFTPMFEMTFVKVTEMFAEAIPGVLIQLLAISTTPKMEDISTAAWLSVLVSALTTGFASATISYDFDTDPLRREESPNFYGYIPAKASKRALLFVLMVIFTGGMLLIRCMTLVILALLDGRLASLYIFADLSLFLIVKLLRRDFWYWVPAGGGADILVSVVSRVVGKVVTDFTSMVQFRHPNEVGGASWMFGFVLSMVSLPVALVVAEPHIEDRGSSLAWTVVMYFIPGSLVCFTVFFLLIERKYWNTFLSTQRGKDLTMSSFLDGESDVIKFGVFNSSRHHWVSIEEKIKKWVGENWAKWEEEKPEWFTDQKKAMVPVEFIPTIGAARRKESVRRASVNAVAEGGLGGALRASIRRASVRRATEGHVKVVPIERDN